MYGEKFSYFPVGERTPDLQYRQLLDRILKEGCTTSTALKWPAKDQSAETLASAKSIIGPQMTFDLRNGIPMITERNVGGPLMQQGIGELFAFLNGASTVAEFEEYGCSWWGNFLTAKKCAKRGLPAGNNGPGSYGPALRNFPTSEGGPFDQVTNMIKQIKARPELRTHMLTPFIPQYISRAPGNSQQVVIAPCHFQIFVHVNTDLGTLSLHHFQRSADAPVGLVYNMVQYGILTLILAKLTGYRADKLVYTINDAHIYDRQEDKVRRLLLQAPRHFPSIYLDDDGVESIFDYRTHHIRIEDYNPHSPMRIQTPI